MSIKQYPVLTVTLGLLGLACLGGAGLAVWQGMEYSKNTKGLKSDEANLRRVLGSEVAPTAANLEAARSNLAQIQERERELFTSLQGSGTRRFENDTRWEATDLVNKLRESSENLNKAVASAGARIHRPNNFGFGFRRYITGGQTPRSQLSDIALEKEVVEYLVDELLKSKDGARNPLVLQAVLREPVEIAPERGARAPKVDMDEYIPTPTGTLRRDGVAKTYYFRLTFTTNTEVLRRFINRVRSSGYPIVVREISVVPAKADVFAPPPELLPADSAPPAIFGDAPPVAPAAPVLPGFEVVGGTASGDPPPPPVPAGPPPPEVKADPSEFTISFEYIIPLQPAPEAAASSTNN